MNKKIFLSIGLLLTLGLATTVFNSCKKDEPKGQATSDDKPGGKPDTPAINLADELSMTAPGNVVLTVQGDYRGDGVRLLEVGNYSGQLPLHFEVNGETCDKTIEVKANTSYRIEFSVTLQPAYYSAYPTFKTYSMVISSGDIALWKGNLIVPGTITEVYVTNTSVW